MIPQKVKVSDGDERDRILAQVRKSFQVVEDIIRQSTQQLLVVLDSATAPNVLAIEDISFEVLTLICEENEATFRCLTSEEDIWDFIDEKLPEEWDSVRGPQVAEAAPETVVYFINHWSRFVYLALSFIYEKQIDKVEKEAVDAERDGSITALSGDRKPRQEYHGEKHISLLFHVLGVDTIVLDYFPSSDMDLPSSITTWQSLVPAKRILGPYIRRFLQNLCVFFGLELEGMRQATVENYTETKDKLKRCYSFNSLADYTVDSIRRRIFAHKRSEPDSLANRKKRMVTIMTFYCDDFWDTDSVVAVNRITELMDLLEKVVTFSASTTIFLCGDICTVLLAFLFDGKVEVHSKAHDRDESLRSDDFDEGNNRYESSGACFAKADFVLPHVDRAAMVEGRLHAGEGTESMPSEVLVSCSDTGEASPGKATTAKKSEERFASRTSPSVTPHNMEGRQSSSIRRPQVEKSSRGRRGLVLMRKFPGWSKYAAIVAEAFKRILSTGKLSPTC
ncbi:hypothetical protein TGMAS_230605 [Toxoplasma gondii MAS]|uniref:Uncharacterized protein n=1 Tax=Toxoplasma gondii MAS TaxID=943118 RepID=A0A086QY27_TOXGO|nr:hypothetical protein TGMAS_230605 [Toxoplasma gondii MAS]